MPDDQIENWAAQVSRAIFILAQGASHQRHIAVTIAHQLRDVNRRFDDLERELRRDGTYEATKQSLDLLRQNIDKHNEKLDELDKLADLIYG